MRTFRAPEGRARPVTQRRARCHAGFNPTPGPAPAARARTRRTRSASPALSPTMEVGTIQKRHAEEGGVKEGDTICEIETDKATIDFTAQIEGVVARLLQPEGVEISIGTPILVKVEDAADAGAFADFEGAGGRGTAAADAARRRRRRPAAPARRPRPRPRDAAAGPAANPDARLMPAAAFMSFCRKTSTVSVWSARQGRPHHEG